VPTVQTNGLETYYEQRGTGPPIVFVHGAILDHSQWDPQVEGLSDDYTVVTYDVRGHGRTGGSAENSYSVDLFADDLATLIDELELQNPVICGLSLGGAIAQVYAARHPDDVAGLVLAGTFTPEILSRSEWVQRVAMLRAAVPLVRLLGYERVERWMVWVHQRIHGEDVSGEYDNVVQLRAEGPKMQTAEFAKVIRALTSFQETAVDYSVIDSVPTLVLYGEHEPGFVRRQAAKLGEEVGDSTVREVPDAGHASNLDAPDWFTTAIREFLAERDLRSPAA